MAERSKSGIRLVCDDGTGLLGPEDHTPVSCLACGGEAKAARVRELLNAGHSPQEILSGNVDLGRRYSSGCSWCDHLGRMCPERQRTWVERQTIRRVRAGIR